MDKGLESFLKNSGFHDREVITRVLEAPPEAPPEGYRETVEVDSPERLGSSLVVVCGVENFSVLEEVLGRSKSNTIVVAEPEPGRLRHMVENRELPDQLASRDLRWVVGSDVDSLGDEIESHLSMAAVPDVCTVPPVESRRGEFSQAFESLDKFKQASRSNLATVERFLVDWYVNFARNLERYLSCESVDELYGALSGQPCVLVGPGPSIEKNLELLRSFEAGWTVALDTALPVLTEIGITPDFVVSVDVGEDNLEYLTDMPGGTTLVAPAYMDPEVVGAAGNFYLFEPNFPAARWLKPEFDSPGYLGQSGSVAVTALDFVKLLAPRCCYMIGVDLGYPGGLAFSKASPRYRSFLDRLNRFTTLVDLNQNKIQEKEARVVETDNGKVLTSTEFLSWRRYFNFLLSNINFDVYRPENYGLPLEGTEPLPGGGPPGGFPGEKSLGKTPVASETNREGLNEKLASLLDDLVELKSRLRIISTLRERNPEKFATEWLRFTRQLTTRDSVTGYFHWAVDRLSRELRSVDADPLQLYKRQFERWNRLVPETIEAVGGWLRDN